MTHLEQTVADLQETVVEMGIARAKVDWRGTVWVDNKVVGYISRDGSKWNALGIDYKTRKAAVEAIIRGWIIS